MAVYRDDTTWRYRVVVKLENGSKVRLSGTPQINTKRAAEDAERAHIERAIHEAMVAKHAPQAMKRSTAPTLSDWFRGGATGEDNYRGAYWKECAHGDGRENRPGTLAEKRKMFEQHIEPELGDKRLTDIDRATLIAFRETLKSKPGRRGETLSAKTVANILGVLTHALRVAANTEVIDRTPAFKVRAVPPPPIEPWTFDEYGRLLGAAIREGEPWATAVLLAGESGLRIGEVIALEWADLDLVANAITIVRQERQGVVGPPKGGKPRTVPMTPRLATHLRGVPRIHVGRVVATAGEPVHEGEAKHALYRICRAAGLPERLWHRLRHTYATHAALLGVNPIRLQHWLGHSTLNMTLRYIRFAEDHTWPIADDVLTAGAELVRPDQRIVVQLGARAIVSCQSSANENGRSRNRPSSRLFLVGAAGIEPDLAPTANHSKRRNN